MHSNYLPMPTAHTFSPRSKVEIVQFEMIRTGSYQQQFIRPWITTIGEDQLNSIVGRVNMLGGAEKISPSSFKNVASDSLTLSPQPVARVPIPNGWSEPRIRWVMRVRVTRASGNVFHYVMRGYTSYMGVTDTGNIAPDMEFIINDIVQMSDVQMGNHMQQIAQGAVQMVDGRSLTSAFGPDVYTMRPLDIFAGISGLSVEQEWAKANHDTSRDLSYRLNGAPMMSNRRNCAPTNVFSDVLKACLRAQALAHFGQDDSCVVDRARSMLIEHAPEENPVLRAIDQAKNSKSSYNSFTFADLVKVDSNVLHPGVTQYHRLGVFDVARLRRSEDSPPTTGSDQTTLAVELLCRVVPAMMAESLLRYVSFISNNHQSGGVIMTLPTGEFETFGHTSAERAWMEFSSRLEDEVLRDIIKPGTTFELSARIRLDNEAEISLKLDNEPPLRVFYPTAFDNLLAPVYTPALNDFSTVVNDFDRLRIAVSHGLDMAIGTTNTPFTPPSNF